MKINRIALEQFPNRPATLIVYRGRTWRRYPVTTLDRWFRFNGRWRLLESRGIEHDGWYYLWERITPHVSD